MLLNSGIFLVLVLYVGLEFGVVLLEVFVVVVEIVIVVVVVFVLVEVRD